MNDVKKERITLADIKIVEVDNMPEYPRIPLPEWLNDPTFRKELGELLERIEKGEQ